MTVTDLGHGTNVKGVTYTHTTDQYEYRNIKIAYL